MIKTGRQYMNAVHEDKSDIYANNIYDLVRLTRKIVGLVFSS